jgi:hypothetical protein
MRVVLALLFATISLRAQVATAEIFGRVQDPSGSPIPGVPIRAEYSQTGAVFTALSNQQGEYHLIGMPPAQYALSAELAGFESWRRSLTLRLADRVSLDIALELRRYDSLTVSDDAPLLETATGAVSFHIDQKKISTLPLDGRNFIPLAALSPGVALPGGGSLLPRIAGSRPRTNEYLYDGISVLQPEPGQVAFYPVIDGIAEFSLNLNAYSPEYGRSNGGTVMVVGKSGGNEFRGSLFEFFRNEHLNARNYFAQQGGKPVFRRNQYGLTLGGPLQKNQTFFFADWQGSRLRTGATRFSTVPSQAQRGGIFSTPVFDPNISPRQPFPLNTIPANRLDPAAVQLLQHYPLPNLAGAANNYVRTATEPDNQDQFDARLDRYFGTRHRAFARYSFFHDDDTPVTPLPDGSGTLATGVIGHALTRGDSLAAEEAWTLSASLLNQARFGYTRRGLHQNPLVNLPLYAVTGFQQLGPTSAAASRFTTSVTEIADTVSMVHSRHTVKFGLDFRREALDVLNPPNPNGAYSFTTSTGNSFASLLLGQVNAFSIDIQKNVIQERAHIAEFFIGDDWRLTDRLTLNIGTRYTLNFPSTEVHNQGAVFNLKTQVLDFPHTARSLECCNFGPRLGLAWRMSDGAVVRAGYGIVWFEQTGITSPFTIPQFPFVQTVGQQSPDNITPAFLLSAGPTVQVSAPNPNSGLGQGVFGADRSNGSGYSQQWNLTVQKTFGQNWNVEIGYLGSKNTRLGIPDANINQLPAGYFPMGSALLTKVANPYLGQIPASSSLGAATIAQQQLLRAFPRSTTVALFRNNVGNSKYNAFTAKLEKRLARGLSFTAAYTWSKLLDDASSVFSQTIFTGPVLNNTGAADAFNRHLEKDVSSGDIPHVFSAAWVYEWKGWQLAGIVRIQAGDAVAVTQGTNNNLSLGYAVQRPNRIANPNDISDRSATRWFNSAAFTTAPQFTIGNSSRNPVRGPGLQSADLMISRTFRLREKLALDFRAEVFNVSNTPPLSDPNGVFGTPAFGTITTAGNPRVFELVTKLRF